MSFFVIPKPSRPAGAPVQTTYIDILYDHAAYLRNNGDKLGPGSLAGKNICVVGGGPAGLACAYLLTNQGALVTLLEASNRIGGRVYSLKPEANNAAIFEMGAMRVPPSEQLFNYFWNDIFNLPAPSEFPDPGKVDTKIVFQNQVYDWPKNGEPPAIFKNVSTGWNNFAGSPTIAHLIEDLSSSTNLDEARTVWQQLVYNATAPLGPERGWSSISFFQGLAQAFVENYQTYGCNQWSAQDFALFGALGLGSGGFGPLFQVNFAEIMRLVVNGLETDQQFYSAGLGSLTDAFASAVRSSIQTQKCVVGVSHHGGLQHPVCISTVNGSGELSSAYYDAAVIATTTRSMQVDMDITEPPTIGLSESGKGEVGSGRQMMPITNEQATAVEELHLMNSSKLFVLTQSKFWQPGQVSAEGLLQNLQTDGLVRGLYCLDYGPSTENGVVLVSYTWGDDSTKYIAIKDPTERFNYLMRSLSPYSELEPFVSALKSQVLTVQLIDWQDQQQFYGAFKLNYPGQDAMNQTLYSQFLTSRNGIFLAGDSVGWCGGWIEGALQTAVNASAAIVQRFCGPSGLGENSPMTQRGDLYDYGP
jgi:tryptophan 2-monooxygenase